MNGGAGAWPFLWRGDGPFGGMPPKGPSPRHKKGQAPAPPFIVAEVNIPQSSVPQQQGEQYAKFDRMVEKARQDDIVYAQLLFDKQKAATKKAKNTLRKDRIADYTVEMDSDEENQHPLRDRRKGILKAPKKVEFNKDVDVTLFGTMSRHESLESLYYGDPNAKFVDPRQYQQMMAQQRHQQQQQQQQPNVVYQQYAPPPPSYVSVVHERPLDDTDLYMYTMRRKRAPHAYQWHDHGGHTLRRKGSLRGSGRRGSFRSMRMPQGAIPIW